MSDSKFQSFAKLLRQERERAGLSMRELAEKIEVNPKMISRWENGLYIPHSNVYIKLLKVLPALREMLGVFPRELSFIRFYIIEEPLTAQNLTAIISALTELSTKYWLIVKRRFSDLIEYTQTHNPTFAEEANVIITRVSYNSPFNMDWKVDLSAPSVAEALVTTVDGITQRQERLEKARLENQAKAQKIKEAEQKVEQDNQKALLEQEEQRLRLEERRLEILEKQLEVQKKGIEYSLEIAGKTIDLLYPGADQATRAMQIQLLLPNIIQLQNSKGLVLTLPVTQQGERTPQK